MDKMKIFIWIYCVPTFSSFFSYTAERYYITSWKKYSLIRGHLVSALEQMKNTLNLSI